jgi:hypothetical protein
MAINPSDTVTVTLAFTEAQLSSMMLNGIKPERTHRQHRADELDSVYMYENEEDEMVLWVIHKNGDVHRESRLFHFSSGWESDAEDSEDDE